MIEGFGMHSATRFAYARFTIGAVLAAGLVAAAGFTSTVQAAPLWDVVATTTAGGGDGTLSMHNACSGPAAGSGAYCGGAYSSTDTHLATTVSQPGTFPGYASAAADLATGELRASASVGGDRKVQGDFIGASAQASIYDTLRFDLGGSTGPVPITVKIFLDGSFKGRGRPWISSFNFDLTDRIDQLEANVSYLDDPSDPLPETTANPFVFNTFAQNGAWSQFGPQYFTGTFLIDPARPELVLSMGLNVLAGEGQSFAAFNHTAGVSFDLPADVSFTSDSGVFLTASSAAPEPSTWTMLLIGLAGSGLVLRYRRKRLRTVIDEQLLCVATAVRSHRYLVGATT